MSCTCDMEPATVWREQERKAIREHRCSDCGGIIRKGERYHSMANLFDGEWTTAKQCADCTFLIHEVGRTFFAACGGWQCVYMGDLPDSWAGICEDMGGAEESAKARQIVAMQHAACEARQGTRKWHLPIWMRPDGDE